jgi:cellulose synthase/poly-beta-1,6-N-acetylglucosamine synthase-like glycosyltransferase
MKIIVLIPTLNPTAKILDVIKNLEDNKIKDIVIVNDGSDNEHLKILEGIKYPIVTHEINMGKGAALKTGFNYIDKNIKKYDGILTIDDDNQHDIDSILRVIKAFRKHTIIGYRDFNAAGVPAHRAFGNKLSNKLFYYLYKFKIHDTQTGLRIYSKNDIKDIISLESNGFEYELEALIHLIKLGKHIDQEPINTIYNKEPNASHYKVIRDSYRVYKIMFSNLDKK